MSEQKQQRPNSGVLFDNNRKEQENHPDMTGTINVEGKEYWISGWWKQGRSQFLSLSVKSKEKLTDAVKRNDDPASNFPKGRAPF